MIIKQATVALALACVSSALAAPRWHELDGYGFEQYKLDFGKTYASAAEHTRRERLFAARLALEAFAGACELSPGFFATGNKLSSDLSTQAPHCPQCTRSAPAPPDAPSSASQALSTPPSTTACAGPSTQPPGPQTGQTARVLPSQRIIAAADRAAAAPRRGCPPPARSAELPCAWRQSTELARAPRPET